MLEHWEAFDLGGAPFLNALRLRGRRLCMKAEGTSYAADQIKRVIADLDGPTVYDQLVKEWNDRREETPGSPQAPVGREDQAD